MNLLKKILNVVFGFTVFFLLVTFLIFIAVKLWPLQFMENIEVSVERMNSVALIVYSKGGPELAIDAFISTIGEMKKLRTRVYGNKQLSTYLDIQTGIAHARLFKLYTLINNNQLAEQEFVLASRMIGKKYKIKTKEQMLNFVETLDKIIK
jgi:hypothetical protein